MKSLQQVSPASRPLWGEIVLPGDKSVSHRSLLLNALGKGSARITGLLESDDVAASARLVQAMGCVLSHDTDGSVIVTAPERLSEPRDVIDCGNSGTTMRIGLGVLANVEGLSVVTGDASLRGRPMARVLEPLRSLGLDVWGREGGTRAPLCIRGTPERPGEFDLRIASAQVKSALLVAGRRLGTRVREPRTSRDHTERMLRRMGASLALEGGWLALEPGEWTATEVVVPGDFSSATFWMVAASISQGSQLVLRGVGLNPTRTGALDALRAMGASIHVEPHPNPGPEPMGDVTVEFAELTGTRIDGELALRCIDELPVLAVAAACASGETVIADASELRKKESDRIARVVQGLRSLGAEVEERPDGMVLAGGGFQDGDATIDADGDHRLAMAFAVAGLQARGQTTLRNADAVATSYPRFFDVLERIRG